MWQLSIVPHVANVYSLMSHNNMASCCACALQGPIGASIIRRSIQGMLEELEYNLWEAILVRLVDYGHTVSPELEMAALRWVYHLAGWAGAYSMFVGGGWKEGNPLLDHSLEGPPICKYNAHFEGNLDSRSKDDNTKALTQLYCFVLQVPRDAAAW